MKSIFLAMLGALFLISACSSNRYKIYTENCPEDEMAALTSFTVAVNSKQYEKAVSYLSERERFFFLNDEGKVPVQMQKKLDALKLTTLAHSKDIYLEEGKLTGIYKKLQNLELASYTEEELNSEESCPEGPATLDPDELERHEVKIVFQDFLKAVKSKNWKKALGYVEETDREIFFMQGPKIDPSVPDRLAKVDVNAWKYLSLKDGKLERVYLAIPQDKTPQEKAARQFIRYVKAQKWNQALAMLTKYERDFLTDSKGNIKPQYREVLKNLHEEEWEAFFLFRGQLSGTLEWMNLGVYGEK